MADLHCVTSEKQYTRGKNHDVDAPSGFQGQDGHSMRYRRRRREQVLGARGGLLNWKQRPARPNRNDTQNRKRIALSYNYRFDHDVVPVWRFETDENLEQVEKPLDDFDLMAKYAEIVADSLAVFLLMKIDELEEITVKDLSERLAPPEGWIALARLMQKDLVDILGEFVYSTSNGHELSAAVKQTIFSSSENK